MHRRSLPRTKLAALILKMNLKEVAPNSTVDFVGIPLAPYSSSLRDDSYTPQAERSAEIIAFNYHLKHLSDGNADLSLQDLGVFPPTPEREQIWRVENETIVTGTAHDPTAWREPADNAAVHLNDEIRQEFWRNKIIPFFNN